MTIFRTGDKVWFGVKTNANFKAADPLSSTQEICEIVVAGPEDFLVRPIIENDIECVIGEWVNYQDQNKSWYPRLVTGVTLVKIAEIIPIHTEVINYRKYETVPDGVIEAAKDRGERAVRRTLRMWPDNKNLSLRETTVTHPDGTHTLTLDWHWVEKE